MSTEGLIRGFFSFIIGLILAYALFMQFEQESHRGGDEGSANLYSTLIDPLLLPFIFLLDIAAIWITAKGSLTEILSALFSLSFSIFLEISLYYAFLLLALPLLRTFFHARTCAILWLLPNFLYIITASWMKLPAPAWVVWLKGDWFSAAALIWAIGFFAVMIWSTAEHLIFRRKLLQHAHPVTDPSVLSLWQQEQTDMQIKKANYRLVISPDTRSPLSIGLFKATTRVVLPDHPYTPEELSLIFRHELVHMKRQDPRTKLFLTFCTAMCWFNPLMWMAMRRSAEDLELSCDETVLIDADDACRHAYAELILNSAADERGYTTCLSANAASLRYRLKNITVPQKRLTGCILFGLLFFLLMTTSGHVAAAYQGDSGLALIFNGDAAWAQLSSCSLYTDSGSSSYTHVDEEALTAYLSSLQLYKLTGNYSFTDSDSELTIIYEYKDGILGVVLKDHTVKVVPFDEGLSASHYYLAEAVDWDYVRTLLQPNH